jgi:hypothetical protein
LSSIFRLWIYDGKQYHWQFSWMWIFDNEEDGLAAAWYLERHSNRPLALNIFIWTALRNFANNLRYVKGVSEVGRPLWLWTNGKYYAKAGWLSDGYPAISAGSGKGS